MTTHDRRIGDGSRPSRRAILGSLLLPVGLSLTGCISGGSHCGPGETSVGTIADNYDEYVKKQVNIKGTTVDGTDADGPTVDDTTGRVFVRGTADQQFESGQCWAITGTVLPETEIPSSKSPTPNVVIEARALERFYTHGHK
ncbi:MAG: hypothetical protein ABEI77_05645 [Halorientalis sp.]